MTSSGICCVVLVAGLRTCRNRLGLSCQLTSGIDGIPPIPGNNLAWKDIGFMPDVEGESKKNERNGENVVRNQ